ncbi:MAG: hypothetical protein GY730_05565 [bacterium]|nr:hypothetical protein [bacterium]
MDTTTPETMNTTIPQTLYNLSQKLSLQSTEHWALIVQFIILLVLGWTAICIWRQLKTQTEQFKIQTDMLKAQLLKERITMGWLTDEPITKEHINNVQFLPKNFMPEKYQELVTDSDKTNDKQKNNNMAEIGKYLYLSKVYDYFLYVYTSSDSMNLEDPLGSAWQERWLKDLLKDKVFMEVRKMNVDSHPKFETSLHQLAYNSSKLRDNIKQV